MNILSKRLFEAMESVLVEEEEDSTKPGSHNHPSSLSVKIPDPVLGQRVIGACLRQQWYYRKGFKPTNKKSPSVTMSAIAGEYYQSLLSDLITSYGFFMGIQKVAEEHSNYSKEVNLSGRSDIIIWDYRNRELAGIEIKSVGDYKSRMVLKEPAHEHIMQAAMYLDHYRKKLNIKRFYIWYIARSENWMLKGKENVSPFTNVWDFYVSLEEDDIWVHTPQGKKRMPYTIKNIKERFLELERYLEEDKIPDREYDLEYSKEKIIGRAKLGLLPTKTIQTKVEKWIAKGAEGDPPVEMGDFECKFCSYKDLCWEIENKDSPTTLVDIVEKETPDEDLEIL